MMPLLFNESFLVFIKFLQVLLWISLPALLVGMLVTTVIHYKNKRKRKRKEALFAADAENLPGSGDGSSLPEEFYLQPERGPVKQIMDQLFQSNAKYIAIRKDFDTLNEKYQKLRKIEHETLKNDAMEMLTTSPSLPEDIKIQYEAEKKELLAELNQLTASYENLEKDNISLREQLAAFSKDETKVSAVIEKWEKEKTELRSKINEQEYLKDVLEEKKLQIGFLQQQLEQRIRNHHMVEQQFRDLGLKFMETREELEIKEQNCKEFESAIHSKEQEIDFLKETLEAKNAQSLQMESRLKELEDQHKDVAIQIGETSHLVDNLREQLAGSIDRASVLERKLQRNQTYFKGLHRKLAEIIEEEMAESPVIIMKPVHTPGESQPVSETIAQ